MTTKTFLFLLCAKYHVKYSLGIMLYPYNYPKEVGAIYIYLRDGKTEAKKG